MENVFHYQDFPAILKKLGIELDERKQKQFHQYALLLQEWNKKMNLTAIDDLDGIYEKHFLDSILPSLHVLIQGSLCDVGAGAGFPGIPLKIVFPDLSLTIVEPLGKRVTFLKEVVRVLELEGVTIYNVRSEDHAQEFRETYDIVTARAVANLNMLSELCIPLVKENGYFLAMKGDKGMIEMENAAGAVKLLGCELEKVDEQQLVDGSKRINLLYRKMKSTPKKYPRKFALIKKSPLTGGKL